MNETLGHYLGYSYRGQPEDVADSAQRRPVRVQSGAKREAVFCTYGLSPRDVDWRWGCESPRRTRSTREDLMTPWGTRNEVGALEHRRREATQISQCQAQGADIHSLRDNLWYFQWGIRTWKAMVRRRSGKIDILDYSESQKSSVCKSTPANQHFLSSISNCMMYFLLDSWKNTRVDNKIGMNPYWPWTWKTKMTSGTTRKPDYLRPEPGGRPGGRLPGVSGPTWPEPPGFWPCWEFWSRAGGGRGGRLAAAGTSCE